MPPIPVKFTFFKVDKLNNPRPDLDIAQQKNVVKATIKEKCALRKKREESDMFSSFTTKQTQIMLKMLAVEACFQNKHITKADARALVEDIDFLIGSADTPKVIEARLASIKKQLQELKLFTRQAALPRR